MPRYIEESCVLERLKPYIADLGYEERANLKGLVYIGCGRYVNN